MKKSALIILSQVVLFLAITTANQVSVKAETTTDAPVEVVEIKEIGISNDDESKSVIEIRWRINPVLNSNVSSFKLFLSVTYADGTTLILTQNADAESVLAQIEVPSAKISKRNPPAFIKNLKASVVAVFPKKPI
jgi:hypothetical protein